MGKLVPPDLDLMKGELSRRSLKEFIKTFWPLLETQPFVDGWVLDAYCEHLAHIRDIRNLLVNVPPGTSKSLVFSVFFFAWQWLHDPSARFLYASYALNLSERDSIKCRRLIASPLYQKCFGKVFQVVGDQDTKRQFENNKTGYRQAIGVGSTTTGLKCNFAICDDPLNAIDCRSEIKKRDCERWFRDSFYNRLNDFGKDCRIVIGQRLARDDLSGFILDNYKESWTHLCIPYEYRHTDYVSAWGWRDPRTEGETLWPERFPDSFINDEKKDTKKFSAQYNQEPLDTLNALFKNFKYYDSTADGYAFDDKRIGRNDTYRIVAADLAVSTTARADYTAIIVADVTRQGELVLVHVLRDKLPGSKLVPVLCEINAQFRPAYFLIEDVAMQKAILDQARAEGLAIRGVKPGNSDKVARSLPLQIRMDAGQVYFPKNAPWVAPLEKELIEFPGGTYDDQVDALSYLAAEANKRNRVKQAGDEVKAPEQTEAEHYRQMMLQGLF